MATGLSLIGTTTNGRIDATICKGVTSQLTVSGIISVTGTKITGTNLLHSLSYPLTGHYNISHGIALGYLLPRLSKFMGFDVDDIIGDYKIDLEFDKRFVIKEAFKYEKIYEFNKDISEEILYEKL